jgi:hypothetical protein
MESGEVITIHSPEIRFFGEFSLIITIYNYHSSEGEQ